MRGYNGHTIVYQLRCVSVICQIFYKATYNKIEQKTGVRYDIVRNIMTCPIKQAGYENINEVLTYLKDLDKSCWIPQVTNGIKLSQDTQNTILNNFKFKFHEAMIDKKNNTLSGISEGKKFLQLIIQNIQHQYNHEIGGQNI